ncbi:MAG TPA: carboxyl transferase domain-containing protein, partial [Acidimicrobiales bacterium]|nr:carboxyl transferase domain-containing protein [Acidimicrobiales bacterium]
MATVVDPGSFVLWDDQVVSRDPLNFADSAPYPERLSRATTESGSSESVLTGMATVHGTSVALIVSEYDFMAGTMGVAAGERIARAFEQAAAAGVPVLALSASGGARMQEGPLALVQMAKTAAAARRYRAGGGCLIVYMAHPTMGGVLASWASLGSFAFAMPEALVGYTGPRVAASLLGRPLPPDAQRAETLLESGLLDDVFPLEDLRPRVQRILA